MYVVTVKSTVEISQNFVAFSEYMNFNFFVIFSMSKKHDSIPLCGLRYSGYLWPNYTPLYRHTWIENSRSKDAYWGENVLKGHLTSMNYFHSFFQVI